jgi:hypothetical protein
MVLPRGDGSSFGAGLATGEVSDDSDGAMSCPPLEALLIHHGARHVTCISGIPGHTARPFTGSHRSLVACCSRWRRRMRPRSSRGGCSRRFLPCAGDQISRAIDLQRSLAMSHQCSRNSRVGATATSKECASSDDLRACVASSLAGTSVPAGAYLRPGAVSRNKSRALLI